MRESSLTYIRIRMCMSIDHMKNIRSDTDKTTESTVTRTIATIARPTSDCIANVISRTRYFILVCVEGVNNSLVPSPLQRLLLLFHRVVHFTEPKRKEQQQQQQDPANNRRREGTERPRKIPRAFTRAAWPARSREAHLRVQNRVHAADRPVGPCSLTFNFRN